MRTSTSLLLAAGTLAVSTAAVFIVLSRMDPAALAVWRLGANVLVFAPLALPRLVRELRRLAPRDLAALALGGVTFGLHFVFFNTGFRKTSYESTVVLLAAQPLFAAVLGWLLLRERVTRGAAASVAVSTAGLVLLVWQDYAFRAEHLAGDLIVLACGLAIVITYTFGRRIRQVLSVPVYVCTLYSFGAATALAYAAVAGQRLWPVEAGAQEWAALALLLAVPTVFGHTLFNHLVKYVPVLYINIVILAEPVIAVLLKYALRSHFDVFRRTTITPLQAAGAAVLFTGVALGFALRREEAVPVSPQPRPRPGAGSPGDGR